MYSETCQVRDRDVMLSHNRRTSAPLLSKCRLINSKDSFQKLLSAKTCMALEYVIPFGLRPHSSQPSSCNAGCHLTAKAVLMLEMSAESE